MIKQFPHFKAPAKVNVFILAYDTQNRVQRAIERFKEKTNLADMDVHYFFIDPHYPNPSVTENSKFLRELSFNHNADYIRLDRNFGQDGNYKAIQKELNAWDYEFNPWDVVCFYDPDNSIDNSNWLRDAKALIENHDYAFVTCGCVHYLEGRDINVYHYNNQEKVLDGITLRELCFPGGFPIGIWSAGFFTSMDLFQSHSFYGGTEGNILNALRKAEKKGCMLRDSIDNRDLVGIDPKYMQWKLEVITKHEHEDFATWLLKQQ